MNIPIDREQCPDWQEWKRLNNLYYGVGYPESRVYIRAYVNAKTKMEEHIENGDYLPSETPVVFDIHGMIKEPCRRFWSNNGKTEAKHRDDTLAYATGIIVILLSVILYMLIRQ